MILSLFLSFYYYGVISWRNLKRDVFSLLFRRGVNVGELKYHFWCGKENVGAKGKGKVESLNSFLLCKNVARFIRTFL
jgi:hypothetical protein